MQIDIEKEILNQGGSTIVAQFIDEALQTQNERLQMMEYLKTIQFKTVSELKIIEKANEIMGI